MSSALRVPGMPLMHRASAWRRTHGGLGMKLTGMDDVVTQVHLTWMWVARPVVPAGEEGHECASPLRSSAGSRAGRWWRCHRRPSNCQSVAVPDVHCRTLDRLAGRGVDDGRSKGQLDAGPSFADVPAPLVEVDVVRPFCLLGGEHAPDEAGGDCCGAGPGSRRGIGECCLESGGAERRCQEASETADRAAACQPLAVLVVFGCRFHGRNGTPLRAV